MCTYVYTGKLVRNNSEHASKSSVSADFLQIFLHANFRIEEEQQQDFFRVVGVPRYMGTIIIVPTLITVHIYPSRIRASGYSALVEMQRTARKNYIK